MKKTPFDFKKIEKKWAQVWEEEHTYATGQVAADKPKQYILGMFPYPSGEGLHTGHTRIYMGSDLLARYYRMRGFAVLHPMGWDAFGLPTENYAIKQKKNPVEVTKANIDNFRQQMKSLGFSYDWEREINTTDPEYYAITQWLFIEFFKHGFLHKEETSVFFCPFCQTGLALEEVMGDGTHERCGNKVEQRKLDQWIFRITEYAESLLQGLDGLDWPAGIVQMQKNWIGKKEGCEIRYEVFQPTKVSKPEMAVGQNPAAEPHLLDDLTGDVVGEVACFTTRPETNYGATFVVLSPEHELSQAIVGGKYEIDETILASVRGYVKESMAKTERERQIDEKQKTGVFTGLYAFNKLNKKYMPIFVGDFVLMNVGTGALVGVPAHDDRDADFAKTMDLETVSVIDDTTGKLVNSGELTGLDTKNARKKIVEYMEKEAFAKPQTTYHLRDWVFSRQRYWGEPIPMIRCAKCADKKISYWDTEEGKSVLAKETPSTAVKSWKSLVSDIQDDMAGWFPVVTQELPVTLPYLESYAPDKDGQSPLTNVAEWKTVLCPHCGAPAQRETDTMPNWAGSCWYQYKFADKESSIKNATNSTTDSPFNEAIMNSVMPVDWYLGGAEHAVLHLLYARFWTHVLNDLGLVTAREPFQKLRNVGMVIAEDGRKMSKSLGNVINPNEYIEEFGADSLRLYVMFMAPYGQEVLWSKKTVQGVSRFVRRVWHTYNTSAKITDAVEKADTKTVSELHKIIRKITTDIADVKFNTPIALMMELLNSWEKDGVMLDTNSAEAFIKVLSPYAPFMAEDIWRGIFGHTTSIHLENWPTYDENKILNDALIIPIQVNGKLRGTCELAGTESQQEIESRALQMDNITRFLGDAEYKVIYIPNKVINFVVRN